MVAREYELMQLYIWEILATYFKSKHGEIPIKFNICVLRISTCITKILFPLGDFLQARSQITNMSLIFSQLQ